MDIALVTGAHKGLGYEWCKQLAQLSYAVVLTSRSVDLAREAADQLKRQGATVYPKRLDVIQANDINEIVRWVRDTFGKIDLLVNNAGINSGTRAKGNESLKLANVSIDHLSKTEVLSMIDVNTLSPILLANSFRPLLAKSKHPIVINIGSWLGSITQKTNGGNYSYALSKSALNMMNRIFAFDVKGENIISVVVNPGWVQTDMGGSKAQFTPEEAVENLIENVLQKITMTETGKFLNYDGAEHPW